jgi:hypothetical protein
MLTNVIPEFWIVASLLGIDSFPDYSSKSVNVASDIYCYKSVIPKEIDDFIDGDWSQENSKLVDRFIFYFDREFGGLV